MERVGVDLTKQYDLVQCMPSTGEVFKSQVSAFGDGALFRIPRSLLRSLLDLWRNMTA